MADSGRVANLKPGQSIEVDLMVERIFSARSTTNVRATPLEPEVPTAAPQRRSRHSTIVNDLYTYHRYKTWLQNLPDGWKNK